ncbi:polyphosphate kinase 1 [Rhodocaloribacter litoris]|uniref:polyphosphate kinase 1 n=1 Tax=Rhodocaloribacter litoris TaxID=2558931 RepID=UPI001420A882|nr:polyphosphate kinase 1 [Rhodocaloribacter litoris]QXD13913.1 polyphosphate kinase 1 [Rhodocaloribacter litoris]
MAVLSPDHLFNRELSWLAFNGRVLQEARDPTVPLLERLKFLAIFSSNLDEFFQVRVASLRSLLRLGKQHARKLAFDPEALLQEITRVVTAQQETFGQIFRQEILPGLETEGIRLLDETQVTPAQAAFLEVYFAEAVRPRIDPVLLQTDNTKPFLKNRRLYLVVELWTAGTHTPVDPVPPQYALVDIPSPPLPRFVEVPARAGEHHVLFLDDVIRLNLPRLFPAHTVGQAFSVKLSRDAELYLEDEFAGDLVEMIRKSLEQRERGLPTRFLYDQRAPYPAITFLKHHFDLADEDLVPGGRYHNFNDCFAFPRFGRDDLADPPWPPVPHPVLSRAPSLFDALATRDHLLHVPYQSFDVVLRLLDEAAGDPSVERLAVTLYRVATPSAVARTLIRAARAGKTVIAFVEVKARFDEESNLHWAEQMMQAGVRVYYSLPGLKVHAKLLLIERREDGGLRRYAYLSTGNFNEKTARLYTDLALLTADPRLADEVAEVFRFLTGEVEVPHTQHLLVAPFALRKQLYALIDREIAAARAGRRGGIVLKLNSLEDPGLIERLYAASRAGVHVEAVVRGICCLKPGLPGLSENIHVRSLLDRFLEHSRLFVFHQDGDAAIYLASADWMQRNMDRRVEVAFPVYDPALRRELHTLLGFQLADNVKARLIDAEQRNAYVAAGDAPRLRAQEATYRYFRQQAAP